MPEPHFVAISGRTHAPLPKLRICTRTRSDAYGQLLQTLNLKFLDFKKEIGGLEVVRLDNQTHGVDYAMISTCDCSSVIPILPRKEGF